MEGSEICLPRDAQSYADVNELNVKVWITWPVSIMEKEPGEYGEWVYAVWGGRGYTQGKAL